MNKTIINPLSGRRIKIGKATFRKVMKLKDDVEELQKRSKEQKQDINKKQNKAREYLLKLNIDELRRDVNKQLKISREKNKEAKKKLLSLNIEELQKDVQKKLSETSE